MFTERSFRSAFTAIVVNLTFNVSFDNVPPTLTLICRIPASLMLTICRNCHDREVGSRRSGRELHNIAIWGPTKPGGQSYV